MVTQEREWRPVAIKDYADDYKVSNFGEVMSTKKGHKHMMKTKFNKRTGYCYVTIGYNGKSITRTVHRLVAEAFIPNPDNKPEVNHINEDKMDNRVSNLEWVSSHENNEWSKHKRYKPVDVFTPDGELIATFTSCRVLADFLGVEKSTVSAALKGRKTSCVGFVLKYANKDKEVENGRSRSGHGIQRSREVV